MRPHRAKLPLQAAACSMCAISRMRSLWAEWQRSRSRLSNLKNPKSVHGEEEQVKALDEDCSLPARTLSVSPRQGHDDTVAPFRVLISGRYFFPIAVCGSTKFVIATVTCLSSTEHSQKGICHVIKEGWRQRLETAR